MVIDDTGVVPSTVLPTLCSTWLSMILVLSHPLYCPRFVQHGYWWYWCCPIHYTALALFNMIIDDAGVVPLIAVAVLFLRTLFNMVIARIGVIPPFCTALACFFVGFFFTMALLVLGSDAWEGTILVHNKVQVTNFVSSQLSSVQVFRLGLKHQLTNLQCNKVTWRETIESQPRQAG